MKRLFKKFVQSYLRFCLKILFFKHNPKVIAITGERDCQLVKERLFKSLKGRVNVRMTPKRYNHDLGVAFGLLDLSVTKWSAINWFWVLTDAISIAFFAAKIAKVIIVDLKIEKVGDMDYFVSLMKPKVVIFTKLDKLLKDEYLKLAEAVPEKGMVLFNKDDELQKDIGFLNTRVKDYSLDEPGELEKIVRDYVEGKYVY